MKKKCVFLLSMVVMLIFSTTFVWAGNDDDGRLNIGQWF